MGDDTREIRHEIEQTRARMGDTVEALTYKADVPARAKDALDERVETVKETVGETVEKVRFAVSDVAAKAKGVVRKDEAPRATPGRDLPEDD